LAKLPELNRIRTRNASAMSDLLEGTATIILPTESAGVTHSWHQYTIRVSDRDGLSGYLKERDIGCGIYYPRLIQDYPHLEQFRTNCPVAQQVVQEVISLPIHPGLTLDDIETVAKAVIGFTEGE
jgi:dTDP-4-amino-4,6-dideoxygalactose transaminase